jgi:hypothetical protein
MALLMELDLEVVPGRSIKRPVLESIVLPELSMILVLELFAELRLLTLVLVFTPVLLLLTFALLPETAERLFWVDDLPERPAKVEVVLLAALLL